MLILYLGRDICLTNDVFFGNFIDGPKEEGGFYEKLPIASDQITGIDRFVQERFYLKDCYPNPASVESIIHFHVNRQFQIRIVLLDNMGRLIKPILDQEMFPGEHQIRLAVSDIPQGIYHIRMDAGPFKETRKLIVYK